MLNAVDKHYIGIASGVNDAVATVASLLAVAVFGIAALTISDTALDRQLSSVQKTTQVRSVIESAKGKFIVEPRLEGQNTDKQIATEAIRQSLGAGIRGSMLLAAMLAAAGALLSALMMTPKPSSARVKSA